MNIVLVNPPFKYFPWMTGAKYNYCRPPLGICYLASYLKKHSSEQHNIRVIDTLSSHKSEEEWISEILSARPDIVGISVVTSTANTSRALAAKIKKSAPSVLLVAGGPHSTIRPGDLTGDFNIAVIGEGEQTFLEIVESKQSGKPLAGIAGTARLEGEQQVIEAHRPMIENLDTIPPPARELLDLKAYYHSFPYNHRGGYFTTMFTARGCPRDCYFCANRSLWNGRLRYHSTEYAAAEIDSLVNGLGMRLIFIDDDDFLSNKKRGAQICEGMISSRLPLKWVCHCCVSSIDAENLRLMKRAGCVEIQIGVESGDASVLKSIKKSPAPEETRRVFSLLKKERMNTWATFIIGHPDDNEKTVRNTISFARAIDPTYASFILLLPFPGSRAFDTYLEKGMLKTTNWDDYSWHGDPVFETPALSAGDMVRLRALAMRKFYLRPRKILSYVIQMIRSGSSREILRNFLSWRSIIGGKSKASS